MALIVRQIALMLVVGVAVGLAVNFAHPRGLALRVPIHSAAESGTGSCEADPAEVPSITLAEAGALCGDCNVAFVDARGGATFAQGHIAGAVHLPPERGAHAEAAIAHLHDRHTLIVYGDNTRCDQAQRVAQRLVEEGHADVRILEGGWPAWAGMNQPTVSGACEECAEQARR